MAPWALISIIEPSRHDDATTDVAATRYKLDDTAPYLLKTTDFGQTWTKITTGIPDDEFTRVIREDPNRRGLRPARAARSSRSSRRGWTLQRLHLMARYCQGCQP